jgi:hypothetical protein
LALNPNGCLENDKNIFSHLIFFKKKSLTRGSQWGHQTHHRSPVTRGASQDEVSRSFEKFSQIFINFDEESNTNARELLQINGTIMLSK